MKKYLLAILSLSLISIGYCINYKLDGSKLAIVSPIGYSVQDLQIPSMGNTSYHKILITPNNIVFVAYKDDSNNGTLTVQKWTRCGGRTTRNNVSNGEIHRLDMASDDNGNIFVVFSDRELNGDHTTVMKLSNNAREVVGERGFADGYYHSITVDHNGVPYIAFDDSFDVNNGTSVMKYLSGQREYVPSPGISLGHANYQEITTDSNNNIIVAYQDATSTANFGLTIRKRNGTQRTTLGTEGISSGYATKPSLTVDSNDNIFVAYIDETNGNRITIQKRNENNREVIGFNITNSSNFPHIMAGPSDNLYLAYYSSKAFIQKRDLNNWSFVGNSGGLSTSRADYTNIAVKHSNEIFITYRDGDKNGATTVLKLSKFNKIIECATTAIK